MSPALQAHLRLLAQLPRREHRRKDPVEQPAKPRNALDPEKVARMAELEAVGVSRTKIARELHVCPASVTNHLGKQTVRRYR